MTPAGGAIAGDEQTVAALGEFGLIAALSGWLRSISPADPRTLVGIGDDAAVLATTVLGALAGRPPVLRSGAAPGDLVAVTGPLGHSAAGLALLEAVTPDGAPLPHAPAWTAPLIAAHRRPQPPYDAGPQAADLGATAMIDISDGLLADLGHIASASGVRIDLSSDRLR